MRIHAMGSLLVAVMTVGCASIVSTNKRQISLNSTPEDAQVVITDEEGTDVFKGMTPTSVTLRTGKGYFHGKNYTITISKEGYETQTLKVDSAINGWYWGNLGFGGLIGFLIVDPLTGHMFTLNPKELNPTLVKQVASAGPDSVSLTVLLLKDIPPDVRSKLVRVN